MFINDQFLYASKLHCLNKHLNKHTCQALITCSPTNSICYCFMFCCTELIMQWLTLSWDKPSETSRSSTLSGWRFLVLGDILKSNDFVSGFYILSLILLYIRLYLNILRDSTQYFCINQTSDLIKPNNIVWQHVTYI